MADSPLLTSGQRGGSESRSVRSRSCWGSRPLSAVLARIGSVILLILGVATLLPVFAGRGQRSADAANSAPAHNGRVPTPPVRT